MSAEIRDITSEERRVLDMGVRRVGPWLKRWAGLQWTADMSVPDDLTASRVTLPQLLAMAYLQGVKDAGEVAVKAGWGPPAERREAKAGGER